MIRYNLRNKDELLEELRVLTSKRNTIDKNYKVLVSDIEADVSVIKAELQLLNSLGKSD